MTTMRQGSLRQLLGQVGRALRRPAKYVGRFGFGALQVLFLPVLVTGTTLTTLYAGQIR
ncbi:ABC transporter permease OS=Streptomyces aurantiogriseus OX=66870 GN=GCM10010251_22690 PE=4 SV=1 [Streptomyces aurantiogriseus]